MLYSEDVGDTTVADDALLPDWFCLESETIYDKLNPRSKVQTKNEQQEQRLEFTCIGEGSNAMVHECHLLLHGLENNYVSISIL